MDVPKGAAMKPPRVLFIPLWRLLIFGIMKIRHYFQTMAFKRKLSPG
jgi:hypothetical protein